MTKEEVLNIGNQILLDANIPNHKLCSEYILCRTLKVSHEDMYKVENINKSEYKKYIKLIGFRCKHIPLDKIMGFTEFFGLNFAYNRNTLTPRVETELLAERIVNDINKLTKKKSFTPKVLDMCAGSGCLGLAIASKSDSLVTMSDVSKKAIKDAKNNYKCNSQFIDNNVEFVLSDLFDNITDKYDIIVCNPPYIKSEDLSKLEIEVRDFDPVLALDGGKDGLDFYRKIIKVLPEYLDNSNNLGIVYFEIGVGQSDAIVKLLSKEFEEIQVIKDYSKIDRFIIAKKRDKDAK